MTDANKAALNEMKDKSLRAFAFEVMENFDPKTFEHRMAVDYLRLTSPAANTGDDLSRAIETIFGFIGRLTESGKLNSELFNAALIMKASLAPRQVDVEALIKECQHDARKQNIKDEHIEAIIKWVFEYHPDKIAQRNLLAAAPTQDMSKCPGCGGPADNGHDRCFPPSPYFCTKCETQDTKGE